MRAGIEGGMRVRGRREGRRGTLRRILGAGSGGGGGGRRLLRKGVRGGRRWQRGPDALLRHSPVQRLRCPGFRNCRVCCPAAWRAAK